MSSSTKEALHIITCKCGHEYMGELDPLYICPMCHRQGCTVDEGPDRSITHKYALTWALDALNGLPEEIKDRYAGIHSAIRDSRIALGIPHPGGQ